MDNGQIPNGLNFERIFTQAASTTKRLIVLASPSYFESPYCKLEIAHALRGGNQVILVQVGTRFANIIPADMPWLTTLNPAQVDGAAAGLTPQFDDYIKKQVNPAVPPHSDYAFRLNACTYLLERLGDADLQQVINRNDWLLRSNMSGGLDSIIQVIRREAGANSTRIQQLCTSLRP